MKKILISTVALSMWLTGCMSGPVRRSSDHTLNDDKGPGGSLVEIIVNYQEYSAFLPWQKKKPRMRSGYGVAVGRNLVLTVERLVRNHQLVEMRRARSGKKIFASVLISDPQAGLALLKVADAEAMDSIPHLEIAEDVPRTAGLNILQHDETSQVQSGNSTIRQISVEQLPWTSHSTLAFKLLCDVSVNGEGAPALHHGRLAGIIIGYESSSRTATMLPYPVIRQFMENAVNLPYEGFASAGFFWSTLVDPAKRSYLGVSEQNRGILILSVLPGTGAGNTLKANDVILQWDGRDIDPMGYYNDNDFGRLSFPHLIKHRREPGDTVPVKIIRVGSATNVMVKLSRKMDSDALIPENTAGRRAEYLVEGGMIIRELTGRYLMAHGSGWEQSVGSRLAHLYHTRKHMPSEPGERIMILAGVLPDPINIGYQKFRNQLITHINGNPVKNMKDVFRIYDRDKRVERIRLQSIGVDLVLDSQSLDDANKRIARSYRLPALSYRVAESSP